MLKSDMLGVLLLLMVTLRIFPLASSKGVMYLLALHCTPFHKL